MMKGVLLCGGDGTRLRPLTLAVNKHLIKVGNMPMVEYPLRAMVKSGIKDIHVVTGGENYPGVVKYLGSGRNWGVNITYSIQDKAGGIAEALGMAETFVGGNNCLVILGDNLFDADLAPFVKDFDEEYGEPEQAMLFAKASETPERFGVLAYENGKLVDVIEKPKDPPSHLILVGIYIYTPDIFKKIKFLRRSDRGELEITDANRLYIQKGLAQVVTLGGYWTDCGTFETLKQAERYVDGEE